MEKSIDTKEYLELVGSLTLENFMLKKNLEEVKQRLAEIETKLRANENAPRV